jgi:hypothetical protein
MPLRHAPDRVEAGAFVRGNHDPHAPESQEYASLRLRCRCFQYVAFQSERQLTFALMLCALAHISRYDEIVTFVEKMLLQRVICILHLRRRSMHMGRLTSHNAMYSLKQNEVETHAFDLVFKLYDQALSSRVVISA